MDGRRDDRSSPQRYTSEQLVAAVNERLEAEGIRPPTGQAAPLLNVRSLRYYATRGLVGEPVEHRGRQALYDDGHVDRLVAVRRLQADGLQLAEVERVLAGAEPERVARLAAGDEEPPKFWAVRPDASTPPSGRAHVAQAAPPPLLAAAAVPPAVPVAPAEAGASQAEVDAAPRVVAHLVDLGHGVVVQLPAGGLQLDPAQAEGVVRRLAAVLSAGRATAAQPPPPSDQERSR